MLKNNCMLKTFYKDMIFELVIIIENIILTANLKSIVLPINEKSIILVARKFKLYVRKNQ